ncbi:hypothetical protein LSUE1_G009620 [Lachnellula suecica]|uniref:Uncharacterized protein n=1 Tax=Lachnellula suecica TaxID=602035 RepID=A0A8T9C0V0_9HELO|nr:hypothetical protein LSUE1_G009620 [Lachnellula suecica]
MALALNGAQEIVIDPNGDLILRFFTSKDTGNAQFRAARGNGLVNGRITAKMQVSRMVIAKNSSYYRRMLTAGSSVASDKVIDIKESKVRWAELWFRAFHGADQPLLSFKIGIPGVWEGNSATPDEMKKLGGWFRKLMENKPIAKLDNNLEDMRMLMFPCNVFNHVEAFAEITRVLAYESPKSITELNPTEHRKLHLDGNVIGSLNSARGSLKSKLRTMLLLPAGNIILQSCICRRDTKDAFDDALKTIGFWHVIDFSRRSVQSILDMHSFINFSVQIPPTACETCHLNADAGAVRKARWEVVNDFHGLCLDCMEQTKTGSVDEDYWKKDSLQQWDRGCRIKHGESTWNFSFMGRKTDMEQHQKKKRLLALVEAQKQTRNGRALMARQV